MILRNEGSTSSRRWLGWLVALGALVVLGGTLFALWWVQRPEPPVPDSYHTDMEKTQDDGNGGLVFAGQNATFLNAEGQTNEVSRSGKHSVLVDKANPFAATLEIEDLSKGEKLIAEVWRKSSDGAGVMVAEGDWGFYEKAKPTGDFEGDWMKLQIEIEAPRMAETAGKVKIYMYNESENPSWFDDLTVQRIGPQTTGKKQSLEDFEVETLSLILGAAEQAKIQEVRSRALREGVLVVEESDWVKATIETKEDRIPAKLRLKGDWTDHLRGDKWSYRISVQPPYSWNRLIVFSVQNPKSRDFLNEWVFHQLLKREGLLTTRYDFVEVKENGESRGIYALEEHFTKQLPESSQRREGPIIKFSEEAFWQERHRELEEDSWLTGAHPVTETANIEAFQLSKTVKDSVLNQEFVHARNMLEALRSGEKTPSEVFDLDKMARLLALCDLAKAWHGLIWHNNRFYYNPVLNRLEPIGFDGYTADGPVSWFTKPFMGYANDPAKVSGEPYEGLYGKIYADPVFTEKYIFYLQKFTEEEYVSDFMQSMEYGIEKREKLLQTDYPQYKYDRDFLFNQAKTLRSQFMPLSEVSVKCHREATGKYKVFNYHCLPVEVIGFGDKSSVTTELEAALYLPAYSQNPPANFVDVKGPAEAKKVFFRIPGIDSTFFAPVVPWGRPGLETPEQELFGDLKIATNERYEVRNDSVIFKAGKLQTDQDLLFPPGYTIVMESGFELDLIKKAKFISKSRIQMLGTPDHPVVITSSDNTANGFSIIQAEGDSKVQWVKFSKIGPMEYKGWNHSGAFTFYESNVVINHLEINQTRGEDALNLVRLRFLADYVHIGGAPFDALDMDFCTGRIRYSTFFEPGNDGMDFSDSRIEIQDCEVESPGDKGLSGGEAAHLHATNLKITGANIGVASKDLSVVSIDKLTLENCVTGMSAYQKKPEFGPAKMYVKELEEKNSETLHRIQSGSLLMLEGTEIMPPK